MTRFFPRNYWMFIIRGMLTVVFGLLMLFFWPVLELELFSTLFGPFVFCEGVVSIIFFIQNRDEKTWLLILDGVVCLVLGIFISYFWQDITNAMIFIFISVWAIITGITRAIVAVSMHRKKQGTWMLDVSALASILFGLIIIFQPHEKSISMIWMISTYAVFFGVLLIILGLYFRRINSRTFL